MIERRSDPEPSASTPSASSAEAAKADAKRLMRISRTGALATFDAESRLPLATLVGVASDWDGAPLFLMSALARHTRNLAEDARASLLLTSQGGRGDPLNQPRLTIGGPVEYCPDPILRTRYLRRYPKAKLYADFTDFSVRRMRIETVHFNGGFGRADALQPGDILTPPGDFSALIAAEPKLLQRVEALGEEALTRLADSADPGRRVWRPSGSIPKASISPPAVFPHESPLRERRSSQTTGGDSCRFSSQAARQIHDREEGRNPRLCHRFRGRLHCRRGGSHAAGAA